MQLHCPNCASHIQSDGVNLTKTIAVCKSCDNIFDFTKQVKQATPPVPYQMDRPHIPTGIDLVEFDDGMEIRFNWRRAGNSFNLMFGLFWNIFLAVITTVMVAVGNWPVLLLLIPFYLVGIYMIYLSVGYLVNTTTIFVDRHFIAVEHRPINFLVQRDKYYTPEETDQLFVKEESPGTKNGQQVLTYALFIRLKDGKEVRLIQNLHSADSARYLERQIEQYLGIENRRIAGEYER